MSSSPTDTQTLVDVLMPQMGTSIAEGTLIGWSKAVGDAVARDETICEISTDKVDTECPSPVAGTVAELLVEVGETVEVGAAIARVAVAVASGSGPELLRAGPVDSGRAHDRLPAVARASSSPPARSARANGSGDGRRPRVSPVVARIAAEHGLELAAITGSGRDGRVTKRDALAAVAEQDAQASERPLHSESPYRPDPPAAALAPADDLGGVARPLSRMRQSIGAAMLRSQSTAATCHTIVECDMSRVEARRRELGVTALPLVARAMTEVLREFPELNATLDGTTITHYARVHLGIAVSLGDDGLIVPVVRDAQNLSEEGLASAIRSLATRARERRLAPDDVRGATFTITNPGAYGATIATPVIDVPQVAILDVEAIVRRPVVVVGADGEEALAIRPMVNLILGWDHRALDGVYAARALGALRARLEQRS